jgi:two-component sensor histidine kinase
MEDIVLDAATTNALGLIIQEIITHYFRISGTGKTKQKVIVFFNREKSTPHYKLVVKESNNNSEFSDIPEAEDTLLSQRLISTLAEQLGGITHFVPGKWNNQTVEIIFNHFDRFVKSTFYQYNV